MLKYLLVIVLLIYIAEECTTTTSITIITKFIVQKHAYDDYMISLHWIIQQTKTDYLLPIDISCLHITQTVRLWTTEEE